MPLTPEDITELNDLRSTILANHQAGKPSHTGIDQDRLKHALELLRKDRKTAESGVKKKTSTKKGVDPAQLDLNSLFTK